MILRSPDPGGLNPLRPLINYSKPTFEVQIPCSEATKPVPVLLNFRYPTTTISPSVLSSSQSEKESLFVPCRIGHGERKRMDDDSTLRTTAFRLTFVPLPMLVRYECIQVNGVRGAIDWMLVTLGG